jgi:hypothetical protein
MNCKSALKVGFSALGLLVFALRSAACTSSTDDDSRTGDAVTVNPKGDEGTRVAYFKVTWPQADLPDATDFKCWANFSWKGMSVAIAARNEAMQKLTDLSQRYGEEAPAEVKVTCEEWGRIPAISGSQKATGKGTQVDPFTVKLGRLDVAHVDVAETVNGSHRTVKGTWRVTASTTMQLAWGSFGLPTGTGIFVFPGRYTVNTHFESINGHETDQQEAVID